MTLGHTITGLVGGRLSPLPPLADPVLVSTPEKQEE